MSGQPDFTLLPTPSDVLRVEGEIRITEINLEDALLAPGYTDATIAELERNLEMLKAWIAPIRRLNTDILSFVFELCGEADWKTPLRIAATSRDWRDLVLVTPRAWEFLPLSECSKISTIKLFVERSDPRPLHIALPWMRLQGRELVSNISHRLVCLTTWVFYEDMGRLAFPNLKRLVIKQGVPIQISWIDVSRYPALRHLVCLEVIYATDSFVDGDPLNLPPLQSLSFILTDISVWLSVLQGCQDTLISLSITVEQVPMGLPNAKLVFPRLTCLEINYWGGGTGSRPLDMETPILETYIEGGYGDLNGNLLHADVDTITQLRVNRAPESFIFPMVKRIQISGEREASLLLRRISSNPASYLQLEIIEVGRSGEGLPDYMLQLVAAVNRSLGRNISLLSIPEHSYLHGSITIQMVGLAPMCLSGLGTDAVPVWS